MMTVLHWMISQSIFYTLIKEQGYSWEGVPDLAAAGLSSEGERFSVNGVGWSPLGIIISIIVGGAMVLLVWLVGFLGRLPEGMPVVRSCSAAISAACHRLEWDADAPRKNIAWGVVKPGEDGTEHAAFSSGEVGLTREGVVYM